MNINTLLIKIVRDLWQQKGRTILVVLAIALGVFGVSMLTTSYTLLNRDLQKNYLLTNPASGTVWIEGNADSLLLSEINNLPSIGETEVRRKVTGRIRIGDNKWIPIWLFVIDDFNNLRINSFFPEAGSFSPGTGELLLERVALKLVPTGIGEEAIIDLPDRTARALKISGTVHDPGLAPAWMEGMAYGYITRSTLEYLGYKADMNEIKFTVSQNRDNEEYINQETLALKEWLTARGYRVSRTQVLPPLRHPHQGQMRSLMFMQQTFGILALLLSAFLVANMITALIGRQIRQIGIMKAIGAAAYQILLIYSGTVLLLGLAALLAAMPLGIFMGLGYAKFAASMLNFTIFSNSIPPLTFILLVIISLLVPLAVAAVPIYQGSRISVREALNDYGVKENKTPGLFTRFLLAIKGLSGILLLAIRNTFRRKGRLILTLTALSLGGALFIATLTIGKSIKHTFDRAFAARDYDIDLSFTRSYPEERVRALLTSVPGVTAVETWKQTTAFEVEKNGLEGGQIRLIAPSLPTEMINFPLIKGRWLTPGDTNAMVVNEVFLEHEGELALGDEITFKLAGQEVIFTLVGVVREVPGLPAVYVCPDYLAQLTGTAGQTQKVMVRADKHDKVSQYAQSARLEQVLSGAGIEVAENYKTSEFRQIIEDHVLIIVNYLFILTILVVLVGGLGLMVSIRLNVSERIRELGVMRAVGASDHDVYRLILWEGGITGLLSWLGAVLLTLPISYYAGNMMSMLFLETTLDFSISIVGMVSWLGVVLGFTTLACIPPARQAVKTPVKDTLAYE